MRRYGAGSVFPSQGRWIAQWELPKQAGKRRRRQLIRATEAEAWKAMRKAQAAEGRSSSRSRRPTESVGSFLDVWLRDVVGRTRRERTSNGYRAIVAKVVPSVSECDLQDPLLGHHIQVWLNSLGKHPRTVAHYAACLRTAFGYAVRKGLMERNPAADLDLPAIPRTERIPLTADELRSFLAAVDGPLAPLWATAAWTGMRSGELLGLRWEDVSLERASLVVRKSLTRLPGKKGVRYVITEPKTNKSRRSVMLVPDVVEALRPLRKAYLRETPELDQGLVFATPSGSPLDAAWVYREFQRALRSTGTRMVRLHDLRHGTASLLIERGGLKHRWPQGREGSTPSFGTTKPHVASRSHVRTWLDQVDRRGYDSGVPRTYGSGSVFQRADGKWVAQWELLRDGSKRRRRQLIRATEDAARALIRDSGIRSFHSLEDRFWSKAVPAGDCLAWTDFRLPKGYGLTRWDGRTQQAHRVAWQITNGPIPDGLNVLHRCDNPPCIRPEHLFLGTAADNTADMVAKGRARQAVPA